MIARLLTDAQRLERAKEIRSYATKLLAYYLALLPLTLFLSLVEWLGDRAENALDWIDGPAYRWRSAQNEIDREIIRDNRRRKEASVGAAPPKE